MPLLTGTVTGTFTDPVGGGPAQGVVTFTPNLVGALSDGTGDVVYTPQLTEARLNASGAISVSLIATDNVGVTPTNWTYTVRLDVTNIPHTGFSMPVLAGTTVNLADVIPLAPSTGGPPQFLQQYASNAETIAGTSTVKAVTPAGLAYERPYFDVRTYGAVGNGIADDTAAIQAAIAAAAAARGGNVIVPAGTWKITAEIIVPSAVNLLGVGASWALPAGALHPSTIFKAAAAAAKIAFEGYGGTSGNFNIDGGSVATGPLLHRRSVAAKRMTQSIGLLNSTTEAWRIDEAQNEVWTNIHLAGTHGGAGLVMDKGAGGNTFDSCEFAYFTTWALVIDETTGTGPYAGGPTHNTWHHCLFEFPAPGAVTTNGSVYIKTGQHNVFRDCAMNPVSALTDGVIKVDGTGIGNDPTVTFDGCWIANTTAGTTGIIQDAGIISIQGQTEFLNLLNAWQVNGGTANVWGPVTYTSVTNRWDAAGAADFRSKVLATSNRPVQIKPETTDFYALRVIKLGSTGSGLDIGTDGRLNFGDSVGATDTVLRRTSAAVLTTDGKFNATGEVQVGGALNHDGTTVGFYAVAPVTRPTAYTQTFATADKTHAARTATTLTDNTAGTANTTLQALADGVTYANDVAAIRNNFADLAAAVNALIADLADSAQLSNAVIDDLQALGLFQ